MMGRRLAYRIALIAGVLAIALIGGAIGFRVIEGYPWLDAFYMTLLTITTVGYSEVHPLGTAGKLFNSFLIVYGVSAMFFSVGAITQTIIELELQKAGAPFVVIDKNDDRVERAMRAGMMAVSADALSDDTLREAGIVHA